MVLCTGVGRQGKPTRLPGYVRSRTLVMLMGVARLESLLRTLTMSDADAGAEKNADADAEKDGSGGGLRDGEAYPSNIPIAIIERASMPDQRTIFGTLETIKDAMDHVGEQRPPGMIVVGWAVLALEGEGDVEVLEDAKRLIGGDGKEAGEELRRKDDERIRRWLGDQRWSVREGFVKWD
ncbi:hypothetical protein FRC15_003100 [Serendipita sp. 397]|nr:hypothetical protein FRC15_003100 [Serendipita sp. 397]